MTFRQITPWAAVGEGLGAGRGPSGDSAAPLRPLPAAGRTPRIPAPPSRLPHLRCSLGWGRGRGGSFHCLGSVPEVPYLRGQPGTSPSQKFHPLGIPEGWGGDVLNFYWLLMLCIFRASCGGEEPAKCQRLKSFIFLSEAFKLVLVCVRASLKGTQSQQLCPRRAARKGRFPQPFFHL